MKDGLIPRRYAKALYKVALERGNDSRLFDLMATLDHSFASNAGLQAVVANPFVDNAEKARLLTTAAGANADDTTFADFLKLLEQNRRIDMARQIALAYEDIYRRAHNIRRVQVVSAMPLDPSVEQRIKDIVKSHIDGGTIEFSSVVDPALIGGFIVNIDNERLDASLRSEFEHLRQSLIN